MREEILAMLHKNAGAFLSGEEISRRLGISRAAVWKHIHALKEEGLQIEAVTRKGYRLLEGGADILCAALVTPHLTTNSLGRNAVFLKSAPSSNLIAKQLAAQGAVNGTIVLVEEQDAGRGRRGRGWANAPGKDICLSALLRPEIEPQYAPRYTLASALGVYELARALGLSPAIKWPNDVLIGGKKICGILLEVESTMEALSYIVVGIGLNVNTAAFPADIPAATSFMLEANKVFSRAEVLAALLNRLEPLFSACADERAYAALLGRYREACQTIGLEIDVQGIKETLHGTAVDVDAEGRLLLKMAGGDIRAVSAGDVTLRRA